MFILPECERRQNQPLPSAVSPNGLPTGFLHSGDEAFGSHLTELNTAQAERAQVAFRTTGDFATVVQANRAGVLGKRLETFVVTILEELCTLGRIFGAQRSTFHLAGFH